MTTGPVTDRPEHVTRYFEDYVPGLEVDCGRFTLTEADIITFARQYDPQPFHTDPEAARTGPFGGLIASGWQTASLAMRQLVEFYLSPESSLGAAGIDELRWAQPVRPGVTLHVVASVLEARRSASKPDRGMVKGKVELTDPDGHLAMSWVAVGFMKLRDPAA